MPFSESNKPSLVMSSTMLRILVFYMNTSGYPNVSSLVKDKVSEQELNDIDGVISESVYDDIYNSCVVLSNDPFFGLKFGSHLVLQRTGALGFLMMNSETLGNALQVYSKFQATITEAVKMNLHNNGNTAKLTFQLFGGSKTGRHRIEGYFAALKAICLNLTNKEISIQKVVMSFQPESHKFEYKKILGVVPEVGSENYLEFDAASLDFPIINSDPELITILESNLNQKLLLTEGSSFA
jgi:hypothetical protein